MEFGCGCIVIVAERRHWLGVVIVAAALMSLPAVLRAALPTDADVSGATSLAGQLLIAAPGMGEPFDHAVVLMVRHNRDGALGLVINQPLDRRPIASLLQALGADPGGATASVQVFRGGPVSPDAAFVIHSAEYRLPSTLDIDGRVAVSDAVDVLRDIGHGKGPNKSLVTIGYAGWAPAQLEDELQRGAWLTVAEDPALVFDDDRAKLWTDALARHRSGP